MSHYNHLQTQNIMIIFISSAHIVTLFLLQTVPCADPLSHWHISFLQHNPCLHILFCPIKITCKRSPRSFLSAKSVIFLQRHSPTSPRAVCVSYLYSRVHVRPSRSPNLSLCSVPPGDRCPGPAGSSAMSIGPVSRVRRSARPL